MRFDQPLTAFALQSSGAAACALGRAHTFTVAAADNPTEAEQRLLAQLALPAARGLQSAGSVRIQLEPAPGLTLTF
jgi:hypothetical protein